MSLLKKIKGIRVLSDGCVWFNNTNSLKTSKKIVFFEKDIRNSKYYKSQKNVLDKSECENFEYRDKFFKI